MKKLFTDDKFFFLTTLIAVLGGAFFLVVEAAYRPRMIPAWTFHFLSWLCLIVIYRSYKSHNKNVMKGMIGAFLMAQVGFPIVMFALTEVTADRYFAVLYLLLVAALFVNHFKINSDRHSAPYNILLNQVLFLMLAGYYAIWSITWLTRAVSFPEGAAVVVYIFAYTSMMAAVICVESRLDAYRQDREAAGWTAEAGYPEGYVHEYKKEEKEEKEK